MKMNRVIKCVFSLVLTPIFPLAVKMLLLHTSTPPSASSLLLIDGCASSEDPFSRGLGLSQGPTDMRIQRNAKQPLGWRAGQPDSSLIQVILSKSHDLSDPTPPCVMKVWVRSF